MGDENISEEPIAKTNKTNRKNKSLNFQNLLVKLFKYQKQFQMPLQSQNFKTMWA